MPLQILANSRRVRARACAALISQHQAGEIGHPGSEEIRALHKSVVARHLAVSPLSNSPDLGGRRIALHQVGGLCWRKNEQSQFL